MERRSTTDVLMPSAGGRPFDVVSEPELTPAERLRMALDLFEAGVAMMELKLGREHPDWTSARVQVEIDAWLHTRPGAEDGDCPGRRVPWLGSD